MRAHAQVKQIEKCCAIIDTDTYTKTLVLKNSTLFVYALTLLLEITFHVEIDASEIFCGNPGAYCSI